MLEKDLVDEDYRIIFFQLKNVDREGHKTTFDHENQEYLKDIEQVDSQIGRVMNAINSRATRDEEEWLIAITTDHGGWMYNHATYAESDRRIFLILSGDGVKKGHIPSDCYTKVSHMDVFPSVFEYMRLPIK